MSKAKFAAARELIQEKKYDQARAILKTIDHPTAQDWLMKLDHLATGHQTKVRNGDDRDGISEG